MVNYYDLLGVSQGAGEGEIRAKLKEKKRIWTQRQNAPKPEQQQEACNNLRVVPEIEATLLNPQKRAAYDQQLRTAPKEEARVDASKIETENLIAEGWRLLGVGNVADALMVATKATEAQGGNPDAWALLAYAKAQWGEVEDAIYEYKKAIKLRPNDASFYYDLGSIYEGMAQWKDAMQQYERAAQIDGGNTAYRAAMGSVFIKNEMFDEGIRILETCLREDPENEGYKYLLAIAYAESSYQNWTFVPEGGPVDSGFYATTHEQVQEAEDRCEKARQVGASDSDVEERLDEVRKNIAEVRKRRFQGRPFVAGILVIFGIFGLVIGEVGGLVLVVCGGLYVVSCMTPQYRANRRIVEGRGQAMDEFMQRIGKSDTYGITGIVFLMLFLALLPFIIVWNFVKNYASK